MMTTMKRPALFALLCCVFIGMQGCKQLGDIGSALTNLQRLKFKLENVNGFQLSGIGLSNKSKLTDFSITDGLSLANSFRTNRFPASFTLNIAAMNPNDGKGGSRSSNATLQALEWRLLIDDVPTITGNIDKPIVIPGTGQQEIIPLTISLDLYEFFGKKGYEQVVDLALAIGGAKGNAGRLKLDAKPTVSTAFGPMTYPGRITIIDKEFRN